jgi:hypothetical protein
MFRTYPLTISSSFAFNAISLGVLPLRASHAVRTALDTVWIVSGCFTRISIVSVDRLNQSGTFIAFIPTTAASNRLPAVISTECLTPSRSM